MKNNQQNNKLHMYSKQVNFEIEFARLKKAIHSQNIDCMLRLIDFCENEDLIDEDLVIDSGMDVVKYTLKVLDAGLVTYDCAEDTIWDIIEDIQTGGNEVYQKSTGYGSGSYELPEHKQTEWKTFKEDILDSLASYETEDYDLDDFEDFEDPRYDPRECYGGYEDEGFSESFY